MKTCPACGRPRLLDAFSGEGGAGAGYMRAGFCVDAVDTSQARLDRYPVACKAARRIKGDAIAYIVEHGHEYAAGHASPPCTGYSQATSMLPDRLARYDRLIGATREAFLIAGVDYVIENVVSKDTRAELMAPLMLCWTEFNTCGAFEDDDRTPLWMRRHRLFESSVPLMSGGGCVHPEDMQCAGAYGGARRDKWEARHIRKGGYVPTVAVMRRLLGTPWMSEVGCRLSIPPAYTTFIGGQLVAHLKSEVAA